MTLVVSTCYVDRKQSEELFLSLACEVFETWEAARWWLVSILAHSLPTHLRSNATREQLGYWLCRKFGRLTSLGMRLEAIYRWRVSVVNVQNRTVEYYQMGEIVTSKAMHDYISGGGLDIPTTESLRCLRLPVGIELFDGLGKLCDGTFEVEENAELQPIIPSGQPDLRPLRIPRIVQIQQEAIRLLQSDTESDDDINVSRPISPPPPPPPQLTRSTTIG